MSANNAMIEAIQRVLDSHGVENSWLVATACAADLEAEYDQIEAAWHLARRTVADLEVARRESRAQGAIDGDIIDRLRAACAAKDAALKPLADLFLSTDFGMCPEAIDGRGSIGAGHVKAARAALELK